MTNIIYYGEKPKHDNNDEDDADEDDDDDDDDDMMLTAMMDISTRHFNSLTRIARNSLPSKVRPILTILQASQLSAVASNHAKI